MLSSVEMFWFSTQLVVNTYKDRNDVFILGNNDDLIAKLDDTMLTVNNILSSRFVEGIREKVERQQMHFRYLQELLDEWILHQRNWLYLEPILSSPYAIKNMPKELKVFGNADTAWKKLMKAANDFPNVKRWADDYKGRSFLKMLANNNAEFEKIQKALDELLEKKREVF